MSGVTIATSLLRSTRDSLNLLFHMFPYNEILKVSKVKSDLIFETKTHNWIHVEQGYWSLFLRLAGTGISNMCTIKIFIKEHGL